MDKKELREYIRKAKRQYSSEELAEQSAVVMERLFANSMVANASIVLMYYSLPDEVNTHFAVDRLVCEGKRVLLPRVISDNKMEIREYSSAEDLQKGQFDIM